MPHPIFVRCPDNNSIESRVTSSWESSVIRAKTLPICRCKQRPNSSSESISKPHSAAVHMAEAGIPMDEIAQYLGHENVDVTRSVYARFSPTYLRKAASVLEYDDLRFNEPKNASFLDQQALQSLDNLVAVAVYLEPVSRPQSLLTGKRIGNFAESSPYGCI